MPNFTFTGPQGQQITVTGPDGSTPEQAFAIAQQHMASQPKPPPESAMMTTGKRALGGLAGDTNAFISGLSAIPQGFAGLGGAAYGAIKGALDPNDTASNAAANSSESAMNAVRNLTPQINPSDPSIKEGQVAAQQGIGAVTNAIPYLTEKGIDLADKGASKILPQSMQGGLARANAALQGLGNIGANLVGPKALTDLAGIKPKVGSVPTETPFSQARGLGLSIPPSYAAAKGGSTFAGPAIEGMVGGAPKTAVEASMKNQPVITSMAAKDISTLDKTLPISDETLDAAAQPYYEKYTAVKNLGKSIPIDGQFKNGVASIGQESADAFPMDSSPALDKLKQAYLQPDSFGSNGAVLKIRQLRKDGGLNIGSMDPERMQLGYAQKKIAGLIEDQMERYASSRPEGFEAPNVIKDFKNARQQIAKIETLRDSIKPGTNDVSASYLAGQLNRGAPLSGNMLKIAEAYNNFKPAMQDAGPLRNKVPVNRLDAMVGSAGAGIGAFKHSASPILGAAGYILAPPLARKGLLSNAYQNSMLGKPANPFVQSLIAPAVLQALQAGNK